MASLFFIEKSASEQEDFFFMAFNFAPFFLGFSAFFLHDGKF
jgi:hypothetical protein